MFPVLPDEPLPPMKVTIFSTAGWASTTLLTASARWRMAGNDTSCGASATPASWPVSCCGNSPLGTAR